MDEASDEADVNGEQDDGRRDVSHPDIGTASLWGMAKTPTARSGTRAGLVLGTRWIATLVELLSS